MKKLVLHIYDCLSARKGLAAAILAVILALCAFSALRMNYEEDITAFLPQSEESGDVFLVVHPEGGKGAEGQDDGQEGRSQPLAGRQAVVDMQDELLHRPSSIRG